MGKRRKIEEEVLDSEDEEIRKALGFCRFKSSKNQDHALSNKEYAAEFKQKRQFSVALNKKSKSYRKD
jgi:hypothetical protein